MHFLKSPLARLKRAWQQFSRRADDDEEVDWDLRAQIEQEVKTEMEERWGPGLIHLKARIAQSKACAEIISDERLSEADRLHKVRELKPEFTEIEFIEQLSSIRVDLEAVAIARNRHLGENEKISRIALLYPKKKSEEIRSRIREIEEEPNQPPEPTAPSGRGSS